MNLHVHHAMWAVAAAVALWAIVRRRGGRPRAQRTLWSAVGAVVYASPGVRSWELGDDPIIVLCHYTAGALGAAGLVVLISRWWGRRRDRRAAADSGMPVCRARRWKQAAAGVSLCAAAVAVQTIPRVRDDGWLAAPPKTVLLAIVRWNTTSSVWAYLDSKYEDMWPWQQRWFVGSVVYDMNGAPTTDRLRRAQRHAWLDGREGLIKRAQVSLAVEGLLSSDAAARLASADIINGKFSGMKTSGTPDDLAPQVAPQQATVAARLLELLDDPEFRVRWAAMVVLPVCGESAWIAEKKLLELAHGAEDSMDAYSIDAHSASMALLAMKADQRWPLDNLLFGITNTEAAVRHESIQRLAILFTHSIDESRTLKIHKALSALVQDKDDEIALAAAWAVGERSLGRPDIDFLTKSEILLQVTSARANRARFLGALSARDEIADQLILRVCSLLGHDSAGIRVAAAEYVVRWCRGHHYSKHDVRNLWEQVRAAVESHAAESDAHAREAIARARNALAA